MYVDLICLPVWPNPLYSLLLTWPSSQISAPTVSLFVVINAVADHQYLFHRSKQWTQCPNEPTNLYGIRTTRASQIMNLYQIEAFLGNKFSHHPLLDRTVTTSAIWYCYCVERT